MWVFLAIVFFGFFCFVFLFPPHGSKQKKQSHKTKPNVTQPWRHRYLTALSASSHSPTRFTWNVLKKRAWKIQSRQQTPLGLFQQDTGPTGGGGAFCFITQTHACTGAQIPPPATRAWWAKSPKLRGMVWRQMHWEMPPKPSHEGTDIHMGLPISTLIRIRPIMGL